MFLRLGSSFQLSPIWSPLCLSALLRKATPPNLLVLTPFLPPRSLCSSVIHKHHLWPRTFPQFCFYNDNAYSLLCQTLLCASLQVCLPQGFVMFALCRERTGHECGDGDILFSLLEIRDLFHLYSFRSYIEKLEILTKHGELHFMNLLSFSAVWQICSPPTLVCAHLGQTLH